MGWAAKFGTGFFQGAAATFPESYARNQENKRREEEQQAATYISLLNQTETEDEANALVAQWQTDPGFVGLSPAVKSRVSAAAKGLGQLQGQKFQREKQATLGSVLESSRRALGATDSLNVEDYKGTPELLRAEQQRLSALTLKDPKLLQDPEYLAAQEELNIAGEQTGIGRGEAEAEELSRKTAFQQYEDLIRTPGVAPEVIRAAGVRAGLGETVIANGIQNNRALVAARNEERGYQEKVQAQQFAERQYFEQQDRINRQRDTANTLVLDPDTSPAVKMAALPLVSDWVREAYAKGGTTASGIPEIDNQRDPIVKKALWDQLDPQVKATANPDFEPFLNRRIQAEEYNRQNKSQGDLDHDMARAIGLKVVDTMGMPGEDGVIPDGAKVAAEAATAIASYYETLAKARAGNTVDWSVAAEDFNTEFLKLGGTARAAQSVYDRLLKTSAPPEEKARVLARLSERNAAFTPLLMQFNQQATTPAPADSSGLTLGQGLAIGGAVGVAGAMEVAANRNKTGNALFPQGRMPLPWEKQTVGEGSVLAKSMAQDSRPGVGERSVVMPERTAFDPNAPATPILQGEGRRGVPPPAKPDFTTSYGTSMNAPGPGPFTQPPASSPGVPIDARGPGLTVQQQQAGKGAVSLTEGQKFLTPQAGQERQWQYAMAEEVEGERQLGEKRVPDIRKKGGTPPASPPGYRGMAAPPEDLSKLVQRAQNTGLISEAEAKDFLNNQGGEEKLKQALTRRLKINPESKAVKRILKDLGAKTPGVLGAFFTLPILLELAEESKERNITGFELFNSLFGPSAAE